jgi:hypothetical protein
MSGYYIAEWIYFRAAHYIADPIAGGLLPAAASIDRQRQVQAVFRTLPRSDPTSGSLVT